MKKLLACSVAAILAASMMTACGEKTDDSSKESKAEATTTTAATTTAAEESEAPAEESAAEESAAEESAADESAAEGEGEEAAQPKPISEMPATIQDLETASLVFTTDMDPAEFVKPMCEKDFENDESDVAISVEEVEGIPMLRFQVLDQNDAGTYKIPKVQFDMSKLFEGQTDVLDDIFTVEVEVMTKAEGMFVGDDGSEALVPGNFMGALVSQPGSDPESLAWKELDSSIAESEWTSEWATYKFTVRPGLMGPWEAVDTTQFFTFMRWGIPNQQDFYFVDITFKDADDNILPCSIGANAKS